MTVAALCEDAMAARRLWDIADPDGDCDGPEWLAYETAETVALMSPCETIEDVRAKARFVLENEGAFDTVQNCFFEEGVFLTVFLRSLLGEGRQ